MSEFDKVLDRIRTTFQVELTQAKTIRDYSMEIAAKEKHDKAIKQTVDKYVIGEDEQLDIQPGIDTYKGDQRLVGRNQMRQSSRQSLWGNQEAGDVR